MCAPYNIICAWALFVVAIMVGLPSLSAVAAGLYISRAKFDDVDDCAIEIIVACLHVGVPIVSLLCTHCVHANRVERQQHSSTHSHRERDTGSPFNYVDLPQSYACRKSTAQQRVHKRDKHTKHEPLADVCCLENTHSHSLQLFIRSCRCWKTDKCLCWRSV